ncbi:hypothetical protein [Rhizobium sp. R711]|uniref:hypothetical protein n=1 Tax=unclassified Rhizobium TaxID=2613769 RepID=UPI0032AFDD18
MAKLEGRMAAVVTSSGMESLHLPLSSLEPNGRVLARHDCHGGTYHRLAALRKSHRRASKPVLAQCSVSNRAELSKLYRSSWPSFGSSRLRSRFEESAPLWRVRRP